ncbi:IS66-like element accessory protein TnpA [Acidisphaera sp. L21]|uniref:IS66-like element accessory protein TnpA n=1 Tax=Acidisphaera sp. L21 TaxID=1641851 RepID=UPI00131B3615|nr:transposase [Acidisphaera sp. L21]
MFDINDDAKAVYRRVEVLTGPGRRRRWSAEEKARIVAEASMPGVIVSEVARRFQVCAQQVFGWRRDAQRQIAPAAVPAFVPLLTQSVPLMKAASVTAIEVKLAGAVVCVPAEADGVLLTSVLRAVRASAREA